MIPIKYVVVLYFVLCTGSLSSSQDIRGINGRILHAKSILKAKKPQLALEVLLATLEALKKPKEDINYFKKLARIYQNIAYVYSSDHLANFEKKLYYQKKAKGAVLKTKDNLLKAEVFYQTGEVYFYYKDLIKAEKYFKKTLFYAKKAHSKEFSIEAMSRLGRLYHHSGDFDKGLSYLKKAERLLQYSGFYVLKGKNYFDLCVVNADLGKYHEAIIYARKAFVLLREAYGKDHIRTIATYNLSALAFFKIGKYDSTYFYLNKSFRSKNPVNRRSWGFNYFLLGQVYKKEKKYKEAIEAFNRSLEVQRTTFGKEIPDNYEMYLELGQIYNILGNYDKALKSLQKALKVNHYSFDSVKLYENPSFGGVSIREGYIYTLQEKAKTWKNLYLKNKEKRYLQNAFDTYLKLINDLNDWKQSLQEENNLLLLIAKSNLIFTEAVETAYLLYQKHKNPLYLNKAFEFAEKSRAYTLLRFLKNTRKSFKSQHKIFEKENNLEKKLVFYKKALFTKESKTNLKAKDLEEINILKDKIFTLKATYDRLKNTIEAEYPDYYKTKYDFKTHSIATIQRNLKKNEALLEYVVGEDKVFIFNISKNQVEFLSQNLEYELGHQIKRLKKSILSKDLQKFCRISEALYQILVQNIYLEKNIQTLKIIPEGVLCYLPFDVLLSQNTVSQNYKTLSYLLRQYSISYDYSATLAIDKRLRKQARYKGKFVLFSPSFEQSKQQDLNSASREASLLEERFESLAFRHSKATKRNLIAQRQPMSVLHLATHGVINNSKPHYSYLILSEEEREDALLYAYELYNLSLRSELVTLSACNTGMGKLQRGEGILSLGRAFAFAGSPNLLVSLWNAPDKATSQIMLRFYDNLSRGLEKDEALRQAKLSYLESADNLTSNPFLWSAFVLIGDSATIKVVIRQPFYRKTWFGVLLAVLLLSLVLVYKIIDT